MNCRVVDVLVDVEVDVDVVVVISASFAAPTYT